MKYKKIKKNLSQIYDDLAVSWGSEAADKWGLDSLKKFAKMVRENGGFRVLDLGCGSGVQSKQLLEEGLEVVGLDLSQKMIEEAEKKISKAKFIVGDMTKMPFTSTSFDGIYARASLLHVPKELMPKALESILKILKSKGILYLAVKKGEGEGEVKEEKYGKRVKRFFSFFGEEEMGKLLDKAGFKIIDMSSEVKVKGSKTVWIEVFARKVN